MVTACRQTPSGNTPLNKSTSCALAAIFLAACGSGGSGGIAQPTGGTPPTGGGATDCAQPLPAVAMDKSIVENIPSDFDPTANPTPTTKVFFTVMLPARCPGDHFPLILQSHGYGGSRLKTLAANGELHPNDPHFPSLNELVQALPFHGYVVISYDERGHGDTVPANGGGYARTIDPRAEVQDARGILDWAFDHADEFAVQTEPATGIPKDVKVGTIGYSYGGGFEMPLAALDSRIDTIVPNGTWYELLYSLLPGDAMKLSYSGLLCLLAQTGNVANTPLVTMTCNAVGIQGPLANTIRTHADLTSYAAGPLASPRTATDEELVSYFFQHGMGYFQDQENQNKPWGFGETQAKLRPVPALFLQGNRDVLFNLSEAYLNAKYFAAAGADVRVLSTEGGHMNPLANQVEGSANCGKVIGVESILAWFDEKLKGKGSATFDAIPKICISVADTAGAPNAPAVGLILQNFPVGSLSGPGAIPATLPTLSASVLPIDVNGVFVPVATIHGSGQVLAGAPRIGKISVARGPGAVQTAIAFVGVGIVRAGSTILVDDQVTTFVEGDHTNNKGTPDAALLLPAVGEQLQDGDQVGLLFYSQHVQYSAVISAASVPNATNIVNTAFGTPIPPVLSALSPEAAVVAVPNIYQITATGVELPILVPGQFPGSSLSK